MSLRIENGFLIISGDRTCPDGCVIVDGERIVYAGPKDCAPDIAASRTINANGGIIAPGFVNTHTHIPMNLLRGYADDMPLMKWLQESIWPAEEKLDEQAVYWGSMLAIAEMAAGGVTCFSDMYNFNAQIAKAADDSGMRALIAVAVLDIDGNGEGRLKRAEDFAQIVKDYKRVDAAIGPHADYTVSPALFEKVRDMAQRLGLRIHVHVSETKGEHEDCIKRHGKTPIALMDSLGLLELPLMAAHCVWLSNDDMAIMARKGASVLSCPGSNLKLGSGIARVAKMLEMGVNVSCATDGAASNNNLSMMEEMTMIALLQKGVNLHPTLIPAGTAVDIPTVNGAKALGMDGITGTLEAGKQADLIILGTDNPRYYPRTNLVHLMVYSGCDADVRLTMVGGDIIYEDGQITFGDIEEIKQKASMHAAKLFA